MGYQLVFSDEFNGYSIDRSKWSFTDYMSGYSDMPTLTSSDVAAVIPDPDNRSTGILRLTASKVGNGQYKTTKSITTGKTMTFVYGYLEMRATVPTGKGVWPSLWLKSNTTAGGEQLAKSLGYNSNSVYETEVDVFEVFGNNVAVPNMHKWWKTPEQIAAYGDVRVQASNNKSYDISDGGWHTYGMLWTPHEISMFIDSNRYMTYDLNDNICNSKNADVGMQEFHNPLCIIINNHLFTPGYTSSGGGSWASNATVTDDFTSAIYDIDYIRLYQKPDVSKIFFAE